MTHHYEWDFSNEDAAVHTFHLMWILYKLGIGYKFITADRNHVMDTTITVEFKK